MPGRAARPALARSSRMRLQGNPPRERYYASQPADHPSRGQQLKRLVALVNDFSRSRFFQHVRDQDHSISTERQDEGTYRVTVPDYDWEDFRSFLTGFRQVAMSEDEPVCRGSPRRYRSRLCLPVHGPARGACLDLDDVPRHGPYQRGHAHLAARGAARSLEGNGKEVVAAGYAPLLGRGHGNPSSADDRQPTPGHGPIKPCSLSETRM